MTVIAAVCCISLVSCVKTVTVAYSYDASDIQEKTDEEYDSEYLSLIFDIEDAGAILPFYADDEDFLNLMEPVVEAHQGGHLAGDLIFYRQEDEGGTGVFRVYTFVPVEEPDPE